MPLPSAGPTDCSSGLAQRIFQNLCYDSKWIASKAGYAVGARGCPTVPNGFGYQISAIAINGAIAAGTTSGVEPAWPLSINGIILDGGVTWKCIEVANPDGRVVSVNPGYVLTATDLDGFRLLAYDIAQAVAAGITSDAYCAMMATTGAGQSFANGVKAIVVFGSIEQDTDSAYNSGTGRFTVPVGKGGNYLVTSSISFSVAVAGTTTVEIDKAASAVVWANKTGASLFETFVLSRILALAAGDVIDIRITQNSGGAQTLHATSLDNHLSINRILGS